MKSFRLFIGILVFFSGGASVFAANAHIVSEIYNNVDNVDTKTAERVAKMYGVQPAEILDFVAQGKMKGDNYDLSEVCTYDDEQKDRNGKVIGMMRKQATDCIEQMQKLWEREKKITETETILTSQTDATARWWDGRLKEKGDYDLMIDKYLLDRQFFGKDALQIQAPKPDEQVRQKYSLAETNFQLPAWNTDTGVATPPDKLPFDSMGGCGLGAVSLFGGLICLPRFCTDFVCVDIKSIPGRRGAPISKNAVEKTVSNIINDMMPIALRLNDAKQITPTRNPNQAYWWAQMFNWDQFWNTNFRAWPKPLPVLEEMIPPDGTEKKKKTSEYGYDARTGYHFTPHTTTNSLASPASTDDPLNRPNAEGDDNTQGITEAKDRIWKELESVHTEFGLCNENPTCNSKELLDSFLDDCELLFSRSTTGNLDNTLDTCITDFEKRADNNPMTNWDSFSAKKIASEKYFDGKMSSSLIALQETIESLLNSLTGINLCALQQAQYSCGTNKLHCVEQ